MIKESKFCTGIMKKHSSKRLIIIKKDDKDFGKCSKYWICDNVYIEGDLKVRDYCHITEKDRSFTRRDCNISVNLNHKISIVFHNLTNYDSHLIIQKLCKFSFNHLTK